MYQYFKHKFCVFFSGYICNRWLAVRLEFLGNLMVFFAALFAVFAGSQVDSAVVGLSISYALNVSNKIGYKQDCWLF